MSSPLRTLLDRARERACRIALPEATDPRTLRAAARLAREDIVQPILVGPKGSIRERARGEGIDLEGIAIEDPEASDRIALVAHAIAEAARGTSTTPDEAAGWL